MILTPDIDPIGTAVLDYYDNNSTSKIIVELNISKKEVMDPAYLFRNIHEMPKLEKKALDLCKSKVLDVGACCGSHSLHLQNKGLEVVSIDISPNCCKIMEKRGLANAICADFFEFNNGKFDTLLFLMNGIGIGGTLSGLRTLLSHCRNLLNDNGIIIFDSSDIDYMYYEDDGSKWIDLNSNYRGEVRYKLKYKDITGNWFNWLFIDSQTLERIAKEEGFNFTLVAEGLHYDYLGILNPL